MRLSRHAKNRLPLMQRTILGLSETAVLNALAAGTLRSVDTRGNRRVETVVGDVPLVIVVDAERELVITMWRED